MKRYAILETGHASESIRRKIGDYSDMFITLLASKDAILQDGRERRSTHDDLASEEQEVRREVIESGDFDNFIVEFDFCASRKNGSSMILRRMSSHRYQT